MAADPSLVEHLKEALEPIGGVSFRRMFGGGGLFRDGLMFALVIGDAVYLKVDDTSRAAFEAEGSSPFTYARKDGRHTLTSYWRAPERLLDDTDDLVGWARTAITAAERAAHKPGRKAGRARR